MEQAILVFLKGSVAAAAKIMPPTPTPAHPQAGMAATAESLYRALMPLLSQLRGICDLGGHYPTNVQLDLRLRDDACSCRWDEEILV